MTKEEIRKEYKQKRRKISASEKDKLEDLMLIQFQKLKLPSKTFLMSYLPIEVQNEYDPWLVEEYYRLINYESNLVYPVMYAKEEIMKGFIVHDENEFVENNFGVLEPIGGVKIDPKDIGIMFVPLVAFDKKGNRVGYGKGYYDKYLATCSPSLIKIGFSFFDPIEINDLEATDKKLNYCITPTTTYKFK
jgi:5-formyltetrahydrofolate cyclo-ligase